MLHRVSGRVALLISVVAVLAVIMLGWFEFVSPQRSQASALSSQISNTELQIADSQKLITGATKRQSLAALHRLQAIVPNRANQPQLLRQLSAIAKTSETELDSVTPTTPIPSATTESLPLTVVLKGHYFAIQRFLRLLRASADLQGGHLVGSGRLFTVDNVAFASGAGGSGASPSVITATMTINAFLDQAAPAAAATAAPTTATSATSASGVPATGQ